MRFALASVITTALAAVAAYLLAVAEVDRGLRSAFEVGFDG